MYSKGSNLQETQNLNFEWFVVKFSIDAHSAFKYGQTSQKTSTVLGLCKKNQTNLSMPTTCQILSNKPFFLSPNPISQNFYSPIYTHFINNLHISEFILAFAQQKWFDTL